MPAKLWTDLFLAVADLCDGGWQDHDKEWVEDAYKKLLNSPMGREIYGKAVNQGNRVLRGV